MEFFGYLSMEFASDHSLGAHNFEVEPQISEVARTFLELRASCCRGPWFNPWGTNVIYIYIYIYRYIYIYIYIYMEHLFLMFLDHTQRRSTVGRTPLDE